MGGMNLHLRIIFNDGLIWLARIRRVNATSPPSALQDYILESEIATLEVLEKTSLPTPKVWGWMTGEGSLAGVSYIFMQHMPGKVLDWSSIDEQGKGKVITQLADFYIELQKHEFDWMGCLDHVGTKRVGPFARECLTDFRGPSREMQPLGPFEHIQDYYKACIGLLLDLIHREEIYADRSVDAFLMYTFLYNLIPQIYPSNPQGEDEEETTTLGLFKGLRKSLGVDGEFGWEEWKEMALERYADDHRLRDILHRSGG